MLTELEKNELKEKELKAKSDATVAEIEEEELDKLIAEEDAMRDAVEEEEVKPKFKPKPRVRKKK